MNSIGQTSILGIVFVFIGIVFLLASFALITPFKETLNSVRGSSSLNCPGTTNFNQTDYDDDNTLEKLTRRPTCMATGFGFLYFFLTFIISVVVWVFSKWRIIK